MENTMNKKENLVQVSTVPDGHVAELEKSYLESFGIKVFIQGDSGTTGVFLGAYGTVHAVHAPWLVYVRECDAEKARELLQQNEEFNEMH